MRLPLWSNRGEREASLHFTNVVTFTGMPGMEKVTQETLSRIKPLTRESVGNITADLHHDPKHGTSPVARQ